MDDDTCVVSKDNSPDGDLDSIPVEEVYHLSSNRRDPKTSANIEYVNPVEKKPKEETLKTSTDVAQNEHDVVKGATNTLFFLHF